MLRKLPIPIAGILLILTALYFRGDKTTVIRGTVVNESSPVAGAVVRLRASSHFTITDTDGNFELTIPQPESDVQLTAWAPGYYITGGEIESLGEHVTLTLTGHPTTDNADYHFISPTLNMDNPTACGNCHRDRTGTISLPVDEWLQDAHATAATNPRFLSLYNGTNLDGTQGTPTAYAFDAEIGIDVPIAPSLGQDAVGAGFRLDFPDQSGTCVMCHVPVAALDAPYNADPNQVTGVARQGISCDFCHKLWNVRLRDNGLPAANLPGVMSLEFLRPHEDEQVFIGPFADTPGDDIYSPLQNRSEFCAACHFGEFWGVTMYNSFGEWLDSPYSDPDMGRTCQDCHMPPSGATVFAQLPPDDPHTILPRAPHTIFSHLMPGAMDSTLLEATVILSVEASQQDSSLTVTVRVTNSGAGHHIPTDNPLRNMILLLTATDSAGQPLTLTAGPTIPDWGGVGNPQEGYYAGQPGVLYAKVLADFYTGETPTYAYWRQTRLVSDNRIPALATDETTYQFALPTNGGPLTVDVQLLLRRAFIDLMSLKGWDTPDMLMAQETVRVEQ